MNAMFFLRHPVVVSCKQRRLLLRRYIRRPIGGRGLLGPTEHLTAGEGHVVLLGDIVTASVR